MHLAEGARAQDAALAKEAREHRHVEEEPHGAGGHVPHRQGHRAPAAHRQRQHRGEPERGTEQEAPQEDRARPPEHGEEFEEEPVEALQRREGGEDRQRGDGGGVVGQAARQGSPEPHDEEHDRSAPRESAGDREYDRAEHPRTVVGLVVDREEARERAREAEPDHSLGDRRDRKRVREDAVALLGEHAHGGDLHEEIETQREGAPGEQQAGTADLAHGLAASVRSVLGLRVARGRGGQGVASARDVRIEPGMIHDVPRARAEEGQTRREDTRARVLR